MGNAVLQKDTKICDFGDRHTNLASFYRMEGGVCLRADVDSLTNDLGYEHLTGEWRHRLQQSKP